MGNQPGKYFEETHQLEHSKFELRALMQTVDGAYDKCVTPEFDKHTEPVLGDRERRCVLEYIRTRQAFHKHFRHQFEIKVCD